MRKLDHEAMVYRHLWALQGIRVPVLIGVVDLRDVGRKYYYDFKTYVVHLAFMSWGGPDLDEACLPEEAYEKVRQEVVRSVRALHVQGVAHTDVRRANVLWMMIDFEEAVLADPPRPALAPVVPNKRARHGKTGHQSHRPN